MKKNNPSVKTNASSGQDRLQKILSQAGVASRREAEKMIVAGRVKVNGEVVTQLGTSADSTKDQILVDDKPIQVSKKKLYCLFHKPIHVMVTRHDPEGRPTVFDYLKEIPERLNTVGRLDFDSEGLILLTNDGDLQARLTHPRHEVPKTYRVKIEGFLQADDCEKLAKGIKISGVDGDYLTQPCRVKVVQKTPHTSWVEIILHEGKNRQIRRMMEAINRNVLRLVRIGLGPLSLDNLACGRWRWLSEKEIESLKKLTF